MSNKRIRKKRAKKRERAMRHLQELGAELIRSSIPPSRNWFTLSIPDEVKFSMPAHQSEEFKKWLDETRDKIAEHAGIPSRMLGKFPGEQ